MKRAVTSAFAMTAILITATFVWAGGMGGGTGGGMGGGGHMMDSYGGWNTGPGQRNGYYDQDQRNGYRDQDRVQRRYDERRHAQEVYDRDMRRLDREMSRKQQALNAELQKKEPDKNKIEALRHDLSELEQRYDDRRAEFERTWEHEDRQ